MKKILFLVLVLLAGCANNTASNLNAGSDEKTSVEPSSQAETKEIKGEKGDKGDKGEQGLTGQTGAKGEKGEAGKDGATIIKNNPVYYLAENPNKNFTSGDIVVTQDGLVYMVVEPKRAQLTKFTDTSNWQCTFDKTKVCIYMNKFVKQQIDQYYEDLDELLAKESELIDEKTTIINETNKLENAFWNGEITKVEYENQKSELDKSYKNIEKQFDDNNKSIEELRNVISNTYNPH